MSVGWEDGLINLRTRLRRETQREHHILDDLVSTFDLTEIEGLRCFLSMHRHALSALEKVSSQAASAPLVRELSLCVTSDLVRLTGTFPEPQENISEAPHPLALDYIIFGSRLGTIVLKGRWANSENAEVLATKAYFSLPGHIELWRAFCTRTEGMGPSSPDADRIVEDARALIDFYTRCAISASRERTDQNA